MSHCPFCRSSQVMPVADSQGWHWMYCMDCKAGGPHKPTPEEAVEAFATVAAPRKPGVIGRLMGRGDA